MQDIADGFEKIYENRALLCEEGGRGQPHSKT
jgi:hypothetical protein